MKYLLAKFLVVASLSAQVGCAGTELATYGSELKGDFGEEGGTHSGQLALKIDMLEKQVIGVVRDLKTTTKGFEAPSGEIVLRGPLIEGENGLQFELFGTSVLKQGSRAYDVQFTMNSGYVAQDLRVVSGWYFAGGALTEKGVYVAYIPMRGRFRAEDPCRTSAIGVVECKFELVEH